MAMFKIWQRSEVGFRGVALPVGDPRAPTVTSASLSLGKWVFKAMLCASLLGHSQIGQISYAQEPESTVADIAPAVSSEQGKSKSKSATKTKRYSFEQFHDINGIGKFYHGREIAQVMGHQGMDWLERPTRELEEGLTLLINNLGLEPGMVAADIGAGSGVLTVGMAEKVGPTGMVMAVDIQKEMLRALEFKCKQLGITNVTPVLGKVKSPNLDPGSLDLALMVDVYHEFNYPYEMLEEISKSMKPGGRIIFVEYRKEDPRVPIKEVHKMTEAQVKLEALQPEFGLKWSKTIDVLPWQHLIVFEKLPEGSSAGTSSAEAIPAEPILTGAGSR